MTINDQSHSIGDLIRASWDQNDPTGWFDKVYNRAKQGEGIIPWAHMQPTYELVTWLNDSEIDGTGKTALVVGCGLGDDAQELDGRGFSVTAFDISAQAIHWCRERFPETRVDFQIADLFDPPGDWRNKFDFVLENRTVQALPYNLYPKAIASIGSFVNQSGILLVLCHGREPEEEAYGIPWALSRQELALFMDNGLLETNFQDYLTDNFRRFIVEYRSNHD